MNNIGNLVNKNVLFLQGPMGTFFKKLDNVFRKKGATTYKIGLNMGDWFYSNKDNYTPFRGTPEDWPKFIEEFLNNTNIDKIFLFGDCRYYQKIARKIAFERSIDVFVFEEGYVRPHHITMEKYGVNAFSQLSRNPEFYLSLPKGNSKNVVHAKSSKMKMVVSATLYYAISNLFHLKYPHYRHHRDFSAAKEFYYGIRGVWRKALYGITEKNYEKMITTELSKKYYFVPMQTHNDFQILQHSTYRSIEKFILEVLESFSRHAPKDTFLIFKHHPVDRGRKNYTLFIREQASLLGIEKKVLVIHDIYLPSCLKHAIGTVTINSTVGLSSIGYGIPTITMGDAVYDMKGLSNKGTNLRKFWHSYKKPDPELYQKFRSYLLETTQLNGSFYGLFSPEFENKDMYR